MKTFGLLNMVYVVFLFCAAAAIASPAQILTTLHSFDGAEGVIFLPLGWYRPATATSTGQPHRVGPATTVAAAAVRSSKSRLRAR